MSSRSESSGRRSSSRRSSGRSRKSKIKGNSLAKKTAAKDGTNFWVMLAGFVFGMTVLLLIVSIFTAEEVNTEMLTADDQNRAEVATRVERRTFDSFVENANSEKLLKTLKSLQDVDNFNNKSNYLTNIQRQLIIADKLMEKPLSDEDRQLVILTRLKNTATLYWTDQFKAVSEADLGLRLREVAQTHDDDADKEIAFEARIQLAKLNSQEATNQPTAFAKEIHQLLADFPNNERVQLTITNSLNFLVSTPENRPATIKVLDQFFKLPEVKGNEKTRALNTILRDLQTLCGHNFFDILEQVQFTGEAGRDQLRDVCLDLAEIPNAGREVAGNLAKSARWLEKNNHYAYAVDIYKVLKESAAKLPNKDDAAQLSQQAVWGIKRCESVGKTVNLAANMYDGIPLNFTSFESMPVLILFWSNKDKTDDLVLDVVSASLRWPKNAVKIVAVQVETDSGNFDQRETRRLAEQYPRWSFCYDDGSGTGPIFSQVPAKENQRIVLLDREHKVYDVNVDLPELVTSVNSVLAIRSDKAGDNE